MAKRVSGSARNDIDKTNFREVAKEAIAKYGAKGMIVDAMFWGRVIGLYEAEIIKRERRMSHAQFKVLLSLHEGWAVDVGFHGMSQMGGLHGTLRSMIRRKWITEKHALTDLGRKAYAKEKKRREDE